MALLAVLAVASATLVVAFYVYRRFFAFKEFKREGIPGPEPHWLLGNAGAFADKTKRHLAMPTWTKKYGKLYGYYDGSAPCLVSSDLDFLTQVFIKQFPSFHAHKHIPLQEDPDTQTDHITMIIARGERWKRLRTIVNPTFSAAKLKSLMPLMEKCQNDFIGLLDLKAATGQEFDILECFKFLTLDTISETAFGIELNAAKSGGKSRNPVCDNLNEMFRYISDTTVPFMLAYLIPELSYAFRQVEDIRGKIFGSGLMSTGQRLKDLMIKVIEDRKRGPGRQDLLQMLLDLEDTTGQIIEGYKGLTVNEIQGTSMFFMIAGFETSSNALSFITFLLANNPDKQQKLLDELDNYFEKVNPGRAVDYDAVHELPYLDCVINEALRLFPIAPLVINRQAMEDVVVNGIRVPNGMPVFADVWTIHRDEEQWGPEDPEKFHPERFQDDYPTKASRHDAAFMPFGYGPRICIGMRFALLEIKLTLVNLLRKYRIEKSPSTGDELNLHVGFTITPADGVFVKLVRRKA